MNLTSAAARVGAHCLGALGMCDGLVAAGLLCRRGGPINRRHLA
jgi:hypothetical protein